MTTREAIERLYQDRDARIRAAHRRGVKVEQIAIDEGLSAARIWQIVKDPGNGASAQAG